MDTAKQSQEWITQREGRNDWDTKEHDQVTWREDGYPARLEGQYCLGEQKQEEVRGGGRGRGERERETGTPRRLPADQADRSVLSEGTETEEEEGGRGERDTHTHTHTPRNMTRCTGVRMATRPGWKVSTVWGNRNRGGGKEREREREREKETKEKGRNPEKKEKRK